MWQRVAHDDWQLIITAILFALTFSTFILFASRALKLNKKQAEALERIPLDDEQ